MEKISWANHVRNEVLQLVKEVRNILQTIITRRLTGLATFYVGNCLIIHVIAANVQGNIEVIAMRGRRFKQLLDDLNSNEIGRKRSPSAENAF